jgi:transcriptional regulator with XRE-family HTH domain
MVKDKLKKKIGKRIKLFRKLTGLNQEEFAAKMGYDSGSSMISQIETGGATMSIEQVMKAAAILNVHPVALLSEKDFSDEDIITLNKFLMVLEDDKNPNKVAISTLINASIK